MNKLAEDNYPTPGWAILRDKINEIVDWINENEIISDPVSSIKDDLASDTDLLEAIDSVPRRLKNGNWMMNGKMLSLAKREEMGLK